MCGDEAACGQLSRMDPASWLEPGRDGLLDHSQPRDLCVVTHWVLVGVDVIVAQPPHATASLNLPNRSPSA